MKTKIIKAALYARVSTEEQAQNGQSLTAQISALRKYALEHDYIIYGEYVDEGISGSKINRPQLDRLMNDLSNIDLILFVKLDRWTRSVKNYYKLQDNLDAHNVKWNAILENYNTETSQGIFTVQIMLSVAEQERNRTSERIRFVFDDKKKNGYMCNGSHPVWFKKVKEDNGYRVVPEDIESIQGFISDCLGGMSIAMACEKYDISVWQARSLISSPHLSTVISEEDMIAVRNTMLSRHRSPRTGSYLFSGMVYCRFCGHKMTGDKAKGFRYYRCSHRRHGIKNRCTESRAIREDYIEDYLLNMLKEKMSMNYEVITDHKENKKKKKVSQETMEKKLERLSELYINGKITRQFYDSKYVELTNSIVTPSVEPIQAVSERFDSSMIELYSNLERSQKCVFWANAIKSITPTDDGFDVDMS